MIDPVSAFAMLTSAHSAISKICKMGKDLSSATKFVTQYAKAEAELGFAKEQKKKGIFGSVMDEAIEKHFQEEEQKRLKDELRSLFLLHGSYGQWERLQATIASARAEHRKRLKEQQRIRDRNLMITVGVVSFILGIGILIMFINYLKYGSAF
nr:hypothetical protein [uncultured Mediterranean phage uvMED]|tara:strand:+ start:1012 stop:1470 length:459 start_codon:yes stop_codon:yes gene_type:complete